MAPYGTKHQFEGRIWIVHNEIEQKDFWCYELEPMDGSQRGTAEWAAEHFDNYDLDDLRDILGIPVEIESLQVLFKGTLQGTYSEHTGEYDEEFDLIQSIFSVMPEEMAHLWAGEVDELGKTIQEALKPEEPPIDPELN